MTGPGGPPALHIYRGLPGSGKTTAAERWVAEDPTGRARVNRDALRAMLHAGRFVPLAGTGQAGPGTEVQVVAVRDAAIIALLRLGVSVACDDTNLLDDVVEALAELAIQHGAVPTVIDLTGVPVETCIGRDRARGEGGGRTVGEAVIRGMLVDYQAQHLGPDGYRGMVDRDQP